MKPTNAIALLYRDYMRPNAATIMEHVNAFPRYSRFGIIPINTDVPFADWLDDYEFQGIVAHYSFLGWTDPRYLSWIDTQRSAFKTAFIQDEYDYCPLRFAFLNRFDFDCVFTLLEPEWHAAVYGAHTSVRRTETTLPGYVSEEMIEAAEQWRRPTEERSIDVGYRARRLPYFMGKGGQEKHLIALEWERHAKGTGLVMDLDTAEESRLYGDAWYAFLGNCKSVLGVEAGTSTFDLEGSLRRDCDAYLQTVPNASFDEVHAVLLEPFEDRIYYRTISPRHFEAAAFGCSQILFEGRYSGILEAGRHYISLKKDFSNFDSVLAAFRDQDRREAMNAQAHEELIASGLYSYKRFMTEHFDEVLLDEGLVPSVTDHELGELQNQVSRTAAKAKWQRHKNNLRYELFHLKFPGRKSLARWAKALGYRTRTDEISLEAGDPALLRQFGQEPSGDAADRDAIT